MRRVALSLAAAAIVAGAMAVPASPSVPITLNQEHVTMQFQGTLSTRWTLGPDTQQVDSCTEETIHGSGTQNVHYKTKSRGVMTITDSGTALAFQLPPADRAAPHKDALGFGPAEMEQQGTREIDSAYALGADRVNCPAPADPQLDDDSGCGGEHVPWDVQLQERSGKLSIFLSAFPGEGFVARCPFHPVHGHEPAGAIGSFPANTIEHFGVGELRRDLSRKNGKVLFHGSQHWHSRTEKPAIVAATTATWKIILIRAHP